MHKSCVFNRRLVYAIALFSSKNAAERAIASIVISHCQKAVVVSLSPHFPCSLLGGFGFDELESHAIALPNGEEALPIFLALA